MEEFLKKVAFFGLGAVSATREKIEEGVNKLVKKGELTAAQGKKLARKLWADAERTRKDIAKKVDNGVKEGLARAGVARMKDVEALKQRVAQLERKLAAYEKRPKPVVRRKTTPVKRK